jgi:diguanylate cyclase (GGDEF)-like protein
VRVFALRSAAVFVTQAVLQPTLLNADLFGGASTAESARLADVYGQLLLRAESVGLFSVDGPAPYLDGDPPVASTLRTFVRSETDRSLVVEGHQDWSPTLAASRTFSRTLDASLIGGIGLLWTLSFPIDRRAGRRLHERTRIDELTVLPNRTALEERLGHALRRLERSHSCVALLFVDLDGFKTVNDTLGHATGDDVLRQIAECIHACTRTADTVSRFAGDEFVVILEDTDDVLAEQVARRILDEVHRPLDGVADLGLSASIGMAATGDAALGGDMLLGHADAAIHHVKSGVGNGYRVFEAKLKDQVARRNQVEVEALLRWTRAELGVVGPDEFIPLAERNGTIEQIGDWVLHQACGHLAVWQAALAPDRPFTVYVNPYAAQLMALDDFGTGYSSLSRLRATPLDLLTLDGSFVNRRSEDGREQAILTAVSGLAREMDIQVLAEGIETQAQLDAVKDLGFDLAQGFYLARPADPEMVDVWIERGIPTAQPVSSAAPPPVALHPGR